LSLLVVNCGSSSLKCRWFGESEDEAVLASGSVRFAAAGAPAQLDCRAGERARQEALDVSSHDHAFDALWDAMLELAAGPTASKRALVAAIGAVGHRVVHGGERFREPTTIDDHVEAEIEALAPLAPLHNPACLLGIRAARRRLPEARHVAVFDTAFHQTLPAEAYLYALPYACYEEDGVRRYGFHGISHAAASARARAWLGERPGPTRIITCHLGAGCSTAAVRDGRSLDTSMGMTPLEGLVMATRSGDVDPGALRHLGERRGLGLAELETLLVERSGLLGLSGLTGDLERLIREAGRGHERAELALRVFAHRVRRYIGAHLAVLGGVDALVFTGGAGEHSPALRARILSGLEGLGMQLDPEANEACAGREGVISKRASPVALYVIAANEEHAIAQQIHALGRG